MKLVALTIESLNIPFKYNFEHAGAKRSVTETLLVIATTRNNIKGLGEGCPRAYVTGETLNSAKDFFNLYRSSLLTIESLKDLMLWMEENSEAIDKNPAAFCAIELAILHALAQEENKTLEQLLRVPSISCSFIYTAILGTKNSTQFVSQLKQYQQIGFLDYKIKIFGDLSLDKKNIANVYSGVSQNTRVRLDANNLWAYPDEAIKYIHELFNDVRQSAPVFALEEPLTKGNYEGCLEIFNTLKIKIILDESFTQKDDFLAIEKIPQAWMLNIRISKMGGLIRSLQIAAQAKQLGIPIIVGAQVGETSILTRAAMTVANAYKNILIAQEGAFGTHLLERDLISPPIMFGQKGVVNLKQVPAIW